jgi:hypothetical protein
VELVDHFVAKACGLGALGVVARVVQRDLLGIRVLLAPRVDRRARREMDF